MSELALFGGTPVLPDALPRFRSIGQSEKDAVMRVLDSDCLSGFYGSAKPEFFGGPQVRQFECDWKAKYGVGHALSVNSATSGLIAALGAVGVGPGDEVIVPPYTMSATVVSPLFWGAIPVFADIEPETFCLDPAAVEAEIGPRTRAILAVNLFGHPARLAELRKIADERGLYLIEDSAQAPLASERGRLCGTIGHVGVFSLNYHKHFHAGEGGVCVTDDDDIARRIALIRNHGENATDFLGVTDIANTIGMNLRLTELGAAVAIEQLKRADELVEKRELVARTLSEAVQRLTGIVAPAVRDGCRHNYYCWVMRLEEQVLGVSREIFSKALAAEGFPHFVGYVRPLYDLPVFQQRIAIGKHGWPFTATNRDYGKVNCPVTERMHTREVVVFEPCTWDLDEAGAAQLGEAIVKVHERRAELSKLQDA